MSTSISLYSDKYTGERSRSSRAFVYNSLPKIASNKTLRKEFVETLF